MASVGRHKRRIGRKTATTIKLERRAIVMNVRVVRNSEIDNVIIIFASS